MASSAVDIFNLACGVLGLPNVQSVTENTRHAVALNAVWPSIRRATLRSHPWNRATTHATLNQRSDSPVSEWDYWYNLPSNCLRPLAINPDSGIASGEGFEIEIHPTEDTEVLVTNEASVVLEYIKDVDNTGLFDDQLAVHMANELARRTAPKFKINPTGLQYLVAVHREDSLEAKGTDGQEGTPRQWGSTWIVDARSRKV